MRTPLVLLALLLLTPAFAALLPAATTPPSPRPTALTSTDVPTWLVGDGWTYSVDALVRNGTDAIDLHGNLTFRVAGSFEVLQGGSYLRLYNSTVSGDVYGRGTFTDPTFGAIPFTITAGMIGGYAWNERGDLSMARTSLALNATGSVRLPLVGSQPLAIVGAVRLVSQPPEEDYDFPITVGDTWQMTATVLTAGDLQFTVHAPPPIGDLVLTQPLNGAAPVETTSWANRTESVTVPAGTFEAFRIETASPGGAPAIRWYAPNASNAVRIETSIAAGATTSLRLWANLTSYAHVNPTIAVQVELVPNRVGPGAPFEVYANTSAPNAAVQVTVPATNFTATGSTDAAGRFSMAVPAPVDNDNTPANTDIGSHGVLVTVPRNATLVGYGAATISLLSPDLTVGGLAAVPTPVGDGLPTQLRATVSVATNVPVYGPVNVTFVSEDVDANRDGFIDNPLSVYCGRGSCIGTVPVSPVVPGVPVSAQVTWIPNPPVIPSVVPVSAIVDPENRYSETNEGNNIDISGIRVEGPDLTPRSATVEILGNTIPFDPAATGFLSPPIPVRTGETANLTVEVWNVGATNASRPTTLAFYNTTGLNGPGDPPFAQGPVPALPAGTGTAPIPASWTAPAGAGMYYVNVTADRGDALRETSEANNTFVLRFAVSNLTAAPDLAPLDLQVPAQASVNRTVWIRTRVENLGLADASAFHVAFYEGSAPTPFAVVPTGALPVGSISSVLSAPWSSSVLGPHAIRIVVDALNEVQESNETNNNATGSVDVVDVPATTLSIGAPEVLATNTTYVLPTTPLSLHAEEHTGLGAAAIWYRVDSGNWTQIAEGAPFTLPAGPHTVYYNSTDRLGGSDPTRSTNVFVDDEPPATSAAVSDAGGGKVVTLAASDNASGVDWTEYRVDNVTWTRYNGTAFVITALGTHFVEFRSADRLGNLEAAKSVVVRVEGGGGTIPVAPSNLKPFLALAFVIVLLGVGWFASPYDERKRRRRWFLAVAVPPAIVEGFTGIASLGVPEMAVPGGSLGLPVDIALLAIGLLVIFFSRRRALRNL